MKHVLYETVQAHYLRIFPSAYYGAVCMRIEVFGVKQKPGYYFINYLWLQLIAKFMQKFLIKGHKQLHIQNYAKCKTFLLKMSVICIRRRSAIHGEVFEFYIIINSGIL